jgi:hypothetical protein
VIFGEAWVDARMLMWRGFARGGDKMTLMTYKNGFVIPEVQPIGCLDPKFFSNSKNNITNVIMSQKEEER